MTLYIIVSDLKLTKACWDYQFLIFPFGVQWKAEIQVGALEEGGNRQPDVLRCRCRIV
jgi:hypothetical protein